MNGAGESDVLSSGAQREKITGKEKTGKSEKSI